MSDLYFNGTGGFLEELQQKEKEDRERKEREDQQREYEEKEKRTKNAALRIDSLVSRMEAVLNEKNSYTKVKKRIWFYK